MQELNIKQLIQVMDTIAEEKNLPEEIVMDIVQQAIAAAWRRDNGDREQDVRAELNTVNGTATVYVMYTVVEEIENPATELTLDAAKALKKDAAIGDVVEEKFEATSFGRVAAQTAKQVVLQKLREAEREVRLSVYCQQVSRFQVNPTRSALVSRCTSKMLSVKTAARS